MAATHHFPSDQVHFSRNAGNAPAPTYVVSARLALAIFADA